MQRNRGFTIVELLIVIVVIAILAAISIVAYNGIQNRANDTAVQNDLNALAKKIESHRALTGELPASTAIALETAFDGAKVSRSSYNLSLIVGGVNAHNLIYCRLADGSSFGLAAWSKSNQGFAYMNSSVSRFNYTINLAATTCPRMLPSWTSSDNMLWLYYSPDGWRASL